MTIDITMPDLGSIPTWAWITAVTVGWYMAVGLFIRWVRANDTNRDPNDDEAEMMFWAVSPAIIPLALIVFTVWTVLAVLSVGIIPPPWKALS